MRVKSKEVRVKSKELRGREGTGQGLDHCVGKTLNQSQVKVKWKRGTFVNLWQVRPARGGDAKAKWEPPGFH